MQLWPSSMPAGFDMKIYRTVHCGQQANFHMMDTWQYRGRSCPSGHAFLESHPASYVPAARKEREVLIQRSVFLRQSWEELAEALMQRGQNCLHRAAFLLQATGVTLDEQFRIINT